MKKKCLLSVAIDAPAPEGEPPKGYELLSANAGLGFEWQAYSALANSARGFAAFQAMKYGHPEHFHHYIITPFAMSASHNDAEIDAALARELTEDESHALMDSLQSFIGKEGDCFTLCDDGSYLWSSQCDQNITSMPLTELHAKSFYGFISQHRERINWHPLFTELQMLLNQHPVNLARRQKALPEVSGAWIWGEGTVSLERGSELLISDDERHRLWSQVLDMEFLLLEGELNWQQLLRQHQGMTILMTQPSDALVQGLKQSSTKTISRWHWQNACYQGRAIPWWRKIWM